MNNPLRLVDPDSKFLIEKHADIMMKVFEGNYLVHFIHNAIGYEKSLTIY